MRDVPDLFTDLATPRASGSTLASLQGSIKRTRNSRGLDEAAWGRISSGSDEVAGQPQRGEIRQPRATSPGYDATIKAKSPNGARFQFGEPLCLRILLKRHEIEFGERCIWD